MHRIIIDLGFFQIASYGLMVAIGMLIGVWIASVRAKKLGVSPTLILDLTIRVIIAGILGARFFYVFIEGWKDVVSQPIGETLLFFFKIRQGGLSYLGALAFSVPVGIIFLKKKGANIWGVADIVAPSIAIGEAFARIGCFLNGCCFGKPCSADAFYAVEFPVDSIPYDHYHEILPIYPTQLINSAIALFIFVILSIALKYHKHNGQVFWLFVLLYSIARFLTDFIRGDSADTFFGGLLFGVLTLAQVLCVAGFILSIAMLIIIHQRKYKKS